MAEYILRDQAIIAVTGAKLPDVSASGLPIANGKRSVTDCIMRLKEIPAADVRPVVKAYWIGEGDGYADGEMVYDVWHCSNCDYTVDEGDNEPPQYNFCPNCGADMREKS
jgi:rubrerythrin